MSTPIRVTPIRVTPIRTSPATQHQPLADISLNVMSTPTPRHSMPDRDDNEISEMNSSPFMSKSPPDNNRDNEDTMYKLDEDNEDSMFSAIPTPRNNKGNDTTNLLDFTDNLSSYNRASPTKRGPALLSPSKTSPDLTYIQSQRAPSPRKNHRMSMANLLDFDIPPPPTPRSMPSITPRELESLRSGFLCEISNLKAELSGKEAETQALKKAVADAEKRTGENMEKTP